MAFTAIHLLFATQNISLCCACRLVCMYIFVFMYRYCICVCTVCTVQLCVCAMFVQFSLSTHSVSFCCSCVSTSICCLSRPYSFPPMSMTSVLDLSFIVLMCLWIWYSWVHINCYCLIMDIPLSYACGPQPFCDIYVLLSCLACLFYFVMVCTSFAGSHFCMYLWKWSVFCVCMCFLHRAGVWQCLSWAFVSAFSHDWLGACGFTCTRVLLSGPCPFCAFVLNPCPFCAFVLPLFLCA